MKTLVISTGTANTASVFAGLRRAGAEPVPSVDVEAVRMADRVVLPGVGAFGAAMARLVECGLVEVLRERIEAGKPTLGICLGLQLLCTESEESPGVAGLGALSSGITRFPATEIVPQMGWNHIAADSSCRLLEDGAAYFANSYRLAEVPDGWSAACSDHGGRFVAAIERGPVLACQFHPELSAAYGQALLTRWLAC